MSRNEYHRGVYRRKKVVVYFTEEEKKKLAHEAIDKGKRLSTLIREKVLAYEKLCAVNHGVG